MSNVLTRRVNKEIENFYNKKNFEKYSTNIVCYLSLFDIELNIISNVNNDQYHVSIEKNNPLNKNTLIMNLTIPQCYPFKPYNVSLNNSPKYKNINYSYARYINEICRKNKFIDNNILYFFYKILYNHQPKFISLSKPTCYCCSSVTCPANWSPSCTINNIIIEYNEIKFIEKYSSPYNFKMLKHIYDSLNENYFNKLPEEVMEIILNYCFDP